MKKQVLFSHLSITHFKLQYVEKSSLESMVASITGVEFQEFIQYIILLEDCVGI